MSFGEWAAHAQPDLLGQHVVLNIGREVAAQQWEIMTGTVEVQAVTEVPEGAEPPGSNIRVPTEIAHALYEALDRLYGHVNQEGKVQALQEALDKERTRVDLVLTRSLGGGVQRPMHRFGEDE